MKDFLSIIITSYERPFYLEKAIDSIYSYADIPFEFGEYYQNGLWFPESLAKLREPFILRDLRGIVLELNAFQYNHAQSTLRVYISITVEIVNNGRGSINEIERSGSFNKVEPNFGKIYKDRFINYNQGALLYTPVEEEGDMLVITFDAFRTYMEPFVEWKMQKGIKTTMVDVSSIGNNSTAIDNYIQAFYDSTVVDSRRHTLHRHCFARIGLRGRWLVASLRIWRVGHTPLRTEWPGDRRRVVVGSIEQDWKRFLDTGL